MSPHDPSCDARAVLQGQFAIAKNFATDFIVDHIDEDLALWKPAPTSVTVHPTGSGWVADWSTEDGDDDLAPATIGWLLWHLEWWWTNTLATIHGEPETPPGDFQWSGGTHHLTRLIDRWGQVLANDDLNGPIRWVLPEPQPLGHIAGWVNFELTKNLSEINQLKMIHASHH